MDTLYFDYTETLSIYERMVERSGGGEKGIIDQGGICKILDFVQNDDYYPTFVDKLSYILFGFCCGHYFRDGNKRIGLTLATYFLLKNGYIYAAQSFMKEMEAITYHLAAGHISKDLLVEIIECIISGIDYPEELKIDIIKIMSMPVYDEYNEL